MKVAKAYPERKGVQLMPLAPSRRKGGMQNAVVYCPNSIKSRGCGRVSNSNWLTASSALNSTPRQEARYRKVLAVLPNSGSALRNIHWLAQGNDRFKEAESVARQLTRLFPQTARDLGAFGETRRRMKDLQGAQEALQKADSPQPALSDRVSKTGSFAHRKWQDKRSCRILEKRLSRQIPDDERIANRIARLAPANEGVWAVDVPSDEDIEAAIAKGKKLKAFAGSDVAYLLDDEVTLLNGDGSTTNVVTMVAKALNQAGRDHLTKMRIRSGGRHRLRHAFAVGPNGERIEASSIRGRTIRFRKLKPGFTTVLQYRIDESADSYLSGHMSRQWWFQGLAFTP